MGSPRFVWFASVAGGIDPGMRSLFEIPESIVYLNAAYLTPMPRRSAEAGRGAIDRRERDFWSITPQEFFAAPEELRTAVGNLWSVSPESVALVPSVSYGVETAVRNLPLARGQRVLLPAEDFPSNVYPWIEAAKRSHASVVTIARPVDFDWATAFVDAIDANTAVVSVPYCDWSDGSLFDLPKISERCKQVGAALVVDVSQAFGAAEIRVPDFDPDFLFSVGYKWQLGPYGLSYLYVADRHRDGVPLENGWITRAGSEDFARLVEYSDRYQSGARRFDMGERAQFNLVPMALESMRLFQELTVSHIADHVGRLSALLCEGLSERGYEIAPRECRSRHLIGARRPNGSQMPTLVASLRERSVFVSARGSALRLSPHLYNTEDDVVRFFRELDVAARPLFWA